MFALQRSWHKEEEGERSRRRAKDQGALMVEFVIVCVWDEIDILIIMLDFEVN